MASKPAILWSNVNRDLDWRGMNSAAIEPIQSSSNNYKEKKKIENSQPSRESVQPTTGRYGSTSQRRTVDTRVMPSFKPFSQEEILAATNNFSKSLMIGQGGYGKVYKCELDNWDVAIKILDDTGDQGLSEYIKEMEVLERMRHEHLIHLMGTCFRFRALVYEYLPNGSLEDCLDERPRELTWQIRTRIIYEICTAIMFLHATKPQPLAHGDLKPHNVLLDANFKVKLTDFGLCRYLTEGQESKAYHKTLHISGSAGYMDPDYLGSGKVTPGVDVYAFGKIIIRLLTGEQPAEVSSDVHRAYKARSLMSIVDPAAGSWPRDIVGLLAPFGLKCRKDERHSSAFMRNFATDLKEFVDDINN